MESLQGSGNERGRVDLEAGERRAQGTDAASVRIGAAALAIAGILFVAYPAIRPFSDEASLRGAAAFASPEWLLAHMLAMVAFTLVGLGLLGLYSALRAAAGERVAFGALVIGWLGIGMTLPFYGGESFGLHALGQEALAQRSTRLVALASVVRSGPGLIMFVVGLGLLGVGAVLAAVAIWRSGRVSRWSGLPFALGFALYIPQFFGTQPLRVAHGVLVALGCLWIAAGLWRRSGAR